MRAIPILTVTAMIVIASAGAAYYSLQDNALDEQAGEASPPISSTPGLNVESTPIGDKQRDQTEGSVQRQFTVLNEKIAVLEARLRDVEVAVSEHAENKTVSRSGKLDVNSDTQKTKAKNISEADFGHWMDEFLDASHVDQGTTQAVMDQAEKSLVSVPDITLADMKCEDRFCRATLVPENGKPLNISQVLDAFEFMDSGTTINEPDGSVKIYFTQPGQSLDELRNEAQKADF